MAKKIIPISYNPDIPEHAEFERRINAHKANVSDYVRRCVLNQPTTDEDLKIELEALKRRVEVLTSGGYVPQPASVQQAIEPEQRNPKEEVNTTNEPREPKKSSVKGAKKFFD